MVIKLDVKDKKILALLDEDARLSNSQIAKKVGLSKPAVEYRLRRFEKNNVIFEYYAVVNFTKFGYSQYKLYFKFQDITSEDEKKIVEHWMKDKNSVWVAQVRGRWDLAVSIIARSNLEFGKILNKFMNQYSQFILAKDVLLLEYSPIYTREYLSGKPSEFVYGIEIERYELDNVDKKIIKTLSVNARIPITELAKKTGLSRDIINYRLKKLIKDNVIVRYRCELNLPVIGINLYKAIFRTKNFGEENEKQIKAYVRQHKKAVQLLKLIGSWDLEIEFEVESEDELYISLNDIRKKFSNVLRDYDIIRITKIFKYTYYPF